MKTVKVKATKRRSKSGKVSTVKAHSRTDKRNKAVNSSSSNPDVEYYKELVKADKERLKNSTGGEAEMILENLEHNKKMLRKSLKGSSPAKVKTLTPQMQNRKEAKQRAIAERKSLGIKKGMEISVNGSTHVVHKSSTHWGTLDLYTYPKGKDHFWGGWVSASKVKIPKKKK